MMMIFAERTYKRLRAKYLVQITIFCLSTFVFLNFVFSTGESMADVRWVALMETDPGLLTKLCFGNLNFSVFSLPPTADLSVVIYCALYF